MGTNTPSHNGAVTERDRTTTRKGDLKPNDYRMSIVAKRVRFIGMPQNHNTRYGNHCRVLEHCMRYL